MNRSPLFLAIRAIGAAFAQRIYIPVVCIAGGIAVIIIALLVWAVTVSGWWWLLLAPTIFVTLVATTLAIIAGISIKFVRPTQTKDQRRKVASFVDTLQKSSEAIQTPKFILLFRLVKDVLFPSEKSYIRELSAGASSLKTDLQAIIASFKK